MFKKIQNCLILGCNRGICSVQKYPMLKKIVFKNIHTCTVDSKDSATCSVTDINLCFTALKLLILISHSQCHFDFKALPWQFTIIYTLWNAKQSTLSTKVTYKFKLYKVYVNHTGMDKDLISLNYLTWNCDQTGHLLHIFSHVYIVKARYSMPKQFYILGTNIAFQVYFKILRKLPPRMHTNYSVLTD